MVKVEGEVNIFRVNTKGLCLLCLIPGTVPSTQSTLAFKFLLRYLKINIYKLCNFSSTFLQAMNVNEDHAQIEINLCSRCDHAANTFAGLYQEMELIRLQLDQSLQSLYNAVSTSYVRASDYKKRMKTGNMWEMFNANLVENLRVETLQKSYQKISVIPPRVGIYKQELEQKPMIFSSSSRTATVASSVSSDQAKRRKPPGPKSKTQLGAPKLKQLLTLPPQLQHFRRPSSHLSQAARDLMQSRSETQSINSRHQTSNDNSYTQNENCMDSTEEFIVKVDPEASMLSNHYQDQDTNEEVITNMAQAPAQDPLGNDIENATPLQINGNISHFLTGNSNSDDLTSVIGYDAHGKNSPSEPGKLISCNTCGKTFDKPARLYGHLAMHRVGVAKKKLTINSRKSRGKRLICKFCFQFFYTIAKYKMHMKSHAAAGVSVIGSASNSSNTSKNVPGLVKIKNKPISKNGYPCTLCPKFFMNSNVRGTHMKMKHSFHVIGKHMPPGTTEDELDVAVQIAFDKHRKTPDDPDKKPYGCYYCISTFPHPSHLRLHILSKHIDSLVSIVLRNKASSNGTDDDANNFQFENDVNGELAVEVQTEEDSLLYEDGGELGDQDHDDNVEHEHESSIYISEPFSLAEQQSQQQGT